MRLFLLGLSALVAVTGALMGLLAIEEIVHGVINARGPFLVLSLAAGMFTLGALGWYWVSTSYRGGLASSCGVMIGFVGVLLGAHGVDGYYFGHPDGVAQVWAAGALLFAIGFALSLKGHALHLGQDTEAAVDTAVPRGGHA